MQNRLGLTLFAGLAIFVAACTGGGATTAPSTPASVAPSAPASGEPSTPASAEPTAEAITCDTKLKVGMPKWNCVWCPLIAGR